MASPQASAAASLRKAYPWTKSPLVTNAPMALIAGPKLVAEVTRAGGLGFVAGGADVKAAGKALDEARQLITQLPNPNLPPRGTILPVGLGVLCFANKLDDFIAVLTEHKPVAVWLFAAEEHTDYARWVSATREASKAAIWIQTNSVTEALDLAKTVKPDVLVLQGSDAGGHGSVRGAGVVSLVPEAVDSLAAGGFQHIPLIAAGGIVDARGTAAALTLGASGVTMGTRFLASEEAVITHKGYQRAILEARDGGQSTVKCKVFDDLAPNGNFWPVSYDGRALRNASSRDSEQGTNIAENRKLHADALKTDGGWSGTTSGSRANGWAGTGVGLVNTIEGAATIVENARDGAIKIITGLSTQV